MIKKAQIKFVCIIMSILLLVFAVIFGATYYLMRNFTERGIDYNLNEVREHYENYSGEVADDNAFVALISLSQEQTLVERVSISENTLLSKKSIDVVISKALSGSYKFGSVDNFCYKIVSKANHILIIATDVSLDYENFKVNVFDTLVILSLIYLVLFIIIVFLSFTVFRPIRESFIKQKQFISNASHELKTPLTIISANADVLKHNQNNTWVDNISSQTERMEFLIQDLLTLAKMDEGKIPLSSVLFNISEVVVNDALAFDAVAFEKGKTLNLYVQPDIQYKGDVGSVKNVVNILLDNAVKHAKKGGEINVYLKKENGKISLTVYNTGSNVPESEQNKVFERFYRADNSRSRESGGSGLGLSIAKSIADNNKWKISAKSKLNDFMSITVIF